METQLEDWRREVHEFCGGIRGRLDQLRAQCNEQDEKNRNENTRQEITSSQLAGGEADRSREVPVQRERIASVAVKDGDDTATGTGQGESDRIQELKRSLAARIAARNTPKRD